uniref:TNF receptor-associated factor n=1 Tax=Callorhinchus milii TaxID=7868 RepID=A0A4W3IBN1_CALMI
MNEVEDDLSCEGGFQSACSAACAVGMKEDCGVNGPCSQPLPEDTQGYDVDFEPALESKYECPICLMALREAVQTPCGHRFCRGCIVKSIRCVVSLWGSGLCPHCFLVVTDSLKSELNGPWSLLVQHFLCSYGLIVPTSGAEISPLFLSQGHNLNCPLANVTCEYCNMELIREQMPNHYDLDCPKAPMPCTFSMFGCPEKMQRHALAMHLQDFTQAHMRLMAQTLRSMSSQASCTEIVDLDGSFLPLLPGSLLPSQLPPCDCPPAVQHLKETLQHLEGRLVRQDHQIRELTAKMETQCGQVGDLKRRNRALEERVSELEAQQCNGIFIWKVENFSHHLRAQGEDQPVVLHSRGFYTGKPGYKLCLRMHLQTPSAQRCSNYISLFVHTMQGEYDTYLPWPFQGTIRLSIIDQSEGSVKHNHEEIMESKPELAAFQRPTVPRNPKGFGYVTFMPLHMLRQHSYVRDDALLVRCEVMARLDMNWRRKEDFQPRSADSGL